MAHLPNTIAIHLLYIRTPAATLAAITPPIHAAVTASAADIVCTPISPVNAATLDPNQGRKNSQQQKITIDGPANTDIFNNNNRSYS